jgi:hypothetical protein
MNLKHKELAESIIADVLQHFPTSEFYSMHPSPESATDIWLEFIVPDEETQWNILEYASEKTTDILTHYGYKLTPMPFVKPQEEIEHV